MCCIFNYRTTVVAAFNFIKRSSFSLLALILVTTLHPTAAHAETKSTGTIKGKVLNASNGAYLKNVTIAVKGTNLQTYSDDYGDYELDNVPVGQVTIHADYVGETQQSVDVTVTSGAPATKDFTFRATSATEIKNGTVKLDPFTVNAERYHNANAVAIAEQRSSINIKNVVSTDAFGDIPNGNVGEFVKFLPGVQVDYGSFNGNSQGYADSDATTVSVRGFGPEDTAIMINGMPVASATPGNLSREVALDQLSINNASRVELIKVITPDMPANSMGGQINLITKSAFEQADPSYSGRVFFNVNSLQPTLKKTVGPVNDSTYKIQPAFEASVIYPIAKNLGVSFDATSTNEINQTYQSTPTWTYTGSFSDLAGTPISMENPALTRAQIADTSRLSKRISTNLGVDWKPTPSQLIRTNFQYSSYNGVEAQRSLDFRPTVAAGADWGPDYTIGTTANSALAQTVRTRDRTGTTKQAQATYNLKKGGWTIDAGANISYSRSDFEDEKNGHYSEVDYTLNPGQVTLHDIDSETGAPSSALALWRTSAASNLVGTNKLYNYLNNWAQDGTLAKSGQALNQDTKTLLKLDVTRDLSFLPFLGSNSLYFQFGGRRDSDKVEKSGLGTGYQESLLTGANYTNAQVLDSNYLGQSPSFGLPAQEWASTYKLYELNQQKPIFGVASTDLVPNYNSYANQQKNITDTTTGYYALLGGKFFKNRLSVLVGGRQETSTRDGKGPETNSQWQYARNTDGSIYKDSFYQAGVKFDGTNMTRTNADGSTTTVTNFLGDSALLSRLNAASVKYPDHLYGATGTSLESRMLNLVTNYPVHGESKGHPSFNFDVAYQLTKKIDLKLSVSRSFKLPNLEDTTNGLLSGNGNFTIADNTTIPADGTYGTITVANPNLMPEQSLNFDGEVAYYTDTGGRFSVAYWRKYVTNQIESSSSYSNDPAFGVVLNAIGLDPVTYDNYILKTSYNSATQQITSGWELQASQDLSFLGAWGKHVSGFLSYSFNTLGQPVVPVPYSITSPDGTAVPVTPTVATIQQKANRFGGAGLQFSSRRLTLQVRATYRNDNEIAGRVAITSGTYAGDFLRKFQPAATSIDVNASYILTKHYSLFLSGRNVLNASRREIFRDDFGKFPAYAETSKYTESGVVWSFGVNGKF
ncbi:MAG TPA: TonB-dependent receptor [Lacunisphaera sp.]|jgi:TonB-dependent receptor